MDRRAALGLSVVALAGCGGKAAAGSASRPARPGPSPPQAAHLPGQLVAIDSEYAEPFALGGLLRGNDNPRKVRGVGVDGGRMIAAVDRRARRLVLYRSGAARPVASVGAGAGPTNLAAAGNRIYVTDTRAGALLEFSADPLRLVRRVPLGGRPYGVAAGRGHVWVTLIARNQLVEVDGATAGRTFATVRRPLAVAVEPVSGAVGVRGQQQVQILHPDTR